MKTNMGSYDIGARFVVGCLICLGGLHFETWWGAVGLLPATTALLGYCPLYALFHFNTTSTDQ